MSSHRKQPRSTSTYLIKRSNTLSVKWIIGWFLSSRLRASCQKILSSPYLLYIRYMKEILSLAPKHSQNLVKNDKVGTFLSQLEPPNDLGMSPNRLGVLTNTQDILFVLVDCNRFLHNLHFCGINQPALKTVVFSGLNQSAVCSDVSMWLNIGDSAHNLKWASVEHSEIILGLLLRMD